MKSTFENLKHWLEHRLDHYYYEGHDGVIQFDLKALLQEVDSFSEEFERQIH